MNNLICFPIVFFFALFHSITFGAIENQGVIGGSFHGINRDASGQVLNQVGAFADFAVPSGIVGKAGKSTLSSKEKSALSAYLRLDDGTLTVLQPNELEWSTSSTDISIADGFAETTQVTDKARVSINLSAEGFTTRVYIRLDPGETIADALSNSGLHQALSQSTQVGGAEGWLDSSWFGKYYNAGNNWIMHENYGWIYVPVLNQPNLWYWHPQQEWVWTGPQVHPHLFRNKDATWLYFMKEALPQKVFYNYETKDFEKASE
jgi:hypothetical protein